MKNIIFSFSFLLFFNIAFSQTNSTCANALPICSGLTNIPSPLGTGTAETGINYDCLDEQPRPKWYFFQVDNQAGDLHFTLQQTGAPWWGNNDIDFIVWGPFTELACGSSNLNNSTQVDCSYSDSATENIDIIGAPANAFYTLLITNYGGYNGVFNLTLDSNSTTDTNCDIICEVDLGPDQVVCGQTQYTITPNTNGTFSSYEWKFNGNTIAGETGSTLTVTQTGNYTLIADGVDAIFGNSCQSEDTISITFQTDDDPSFTMASSCNGAVANVTGTIGGAFAFNPTPTDGATINTTTGTINNGVLGTQYFVEYTTNGSCPNSQIVPVTINTNQTPTITAPATLSINGCDETVITATNARYSYSATTSGDIKGSYVTTGYTASDNDGTIASITYIDVITSAANACPVVVNRTFTATDDCGATSTVEQTITVSAPALVVSDVTDMSSNACDYADQAAVDTAFQSWLSGFTVTGGCDPQATDLTSLSAPILCAGGTVNVTYDVTDLCGTAQDVASFTITAAPALVISDVSDMSSNACDYADQAAVDTAFQSWLSGFTVTGGCDPQATDLTSLSAPILCSGGTVNVTYNVTDLCGTAQDVASFTITAAPALVVSDVSDMSSNACDYADQAAVDTAFQSWLSGFTVTGGCDPQATDLTSLSAPILCAGGTVNVTYNVTDLCGTAQDVASFTITAAPALVVSDVTDMSSNACDYADQAAVDTAFQSWLSGFTVTGGCDPQATDLTSLSAPILCSGGTVNVTYNVTDLCGTAQDVASFTITAAPALVVSDVSDMSSNACDYADQAAVDTAFQSWLSGFTVTGGCDPQATDLTSLSAPILCAGGTVNVTYNVTDLCGTAQDVASFTITAAPALVVSDVTDMSSNACDYADQAAVDTAFQSWLSGFTVTGGCDPQATDLTSLSAPILCAGGTVNVTYNVTDLCGTAQYVASFTITAAPALVVSDVSDMSSNACDYADQAAVDTAFQSWLSGFTVTGGCDPQATDLTSLSAPILCAGGTVNVTYNVTDLCGTAQDVASFTITAAPALVVSDVSDMSSNACDYADQAAVDTAFQSWLSGFTVTGGCDPQATDLTSLSAPILCAGGTVNVTYNVTDLCGTAQDVASFTITAAPALVVSDVSDMSSNACDYADQAAVDTAFQSWLSGFTVTGGCDPQATDLTSLSAPILCAGGTVNVTYNVTDLCGTAQDVASFTITAAPALVVSDVTDMSSNACDYADQAAVDTAFQSWLSGFTVTGGCDPQATDLTSLSAPILCSGGTVNVTYNVTDLCGTAQDVASFTITAAPALVVSDVSDMSSNACDYADQAAVDTAFQSWLSGFTVTGGCDPQATDLTSLSAPILCAGGTVNVTYNVTDLCGTAQDVASFTITAAPALVVSDVTDMSSNACDYADQAAVDTAFQSWLSGFTVTGGCDPQATDLTSLSAPILCAGGTVNVTYDVTDLCGTAQDVASFTITAAPALVVSDVSDMSSNACDYADQAAVDTAFQSWLSGFTVTGGCDPQATDLTSLSAPILCAGGTVNVTYNVTDLCGTAQDVASFTITAAPALVVSDVSDMSSNACDYADQAAVDTAFQSWLSGFTVTGGCDPQATDLTSLSAPILCAGGTVNVTYNVTDLCGTAQDVASFTITAAPALVVSDVSDMSSNACDYADQAAVDTAFQSWLSGFTVTGGCDPQATDLTSLSAPILCAGGTVNVTYNVTDLCGTAQDVASFTITAAPALVVSDVTDMSSNACDYADQAAVDTAFQSWLSGFTVTGGCDPQATDLTSLSAPILCSGGTVNVTYNVTDLCGTAQDVASFTITAAPALVVSDVSDMSSNACDYADQAAVDTAFQSWLSGFTVTGGCDPQATDLTSLSAPILCAGGTVNVTYNVTDLCGTAQDVASFTITAAPALVVSDVTDMSSNACDYADQAAVDTAFQSWLSGFTVTGGCDPQATDLTSLSAPILCAGGTVNVTYNVTDLCGTAQDVASFTITAAPALVVSDVSDMSSNACDYADQAAVDTAFQSWLSGFTVTGGCDPQATDLTSLSAPILCAGGTVNVTYNVTDLCGTAQDVASFTITAAPALVVSDVSDMSSNACDYADQAAVDTAFQSWLSGFTVTGGCDPQATDLTSLSAPILCAGGTVNVTYNVTDLCGTAQDVASFTITAAPALVVSDVSDMSSNACDYADQAAVDTAFQSWLSGFTVTGGCDPQATDLTSLSAPILCAGGTVNVTYNVTDLCGTAQDVASFTITAAPALVVSDVTDMSSNACDYADQAAVDTAFQSWLSGFTVTGGCDPQATDLTSLSAPILCSGGTVNVTYNVTDLCGTAQDVASFTITAAPALVVSDVSDMSSNACDYADQAAVDTAFQSWLSGFTVTGGCDPQATDLTSLSAPILCSGGTVNVTYNVTDLCGTAQDVASFTITAAPALVVSDVTDMSSNACDYADQAAVDTAFQSWLSGFTVTGGCDPQATDLTSLSAPILCAGGTVNVTYNVTDLCGTAQDVASFTITAAPALVVSDVSDMSSNACDYADQAAVDTAFQSWLSGFTVTGGCDPQATDLTSLSAPILCAGGTVNVTYNVTDLCGTAQDVASFTITAAPALVVSDVSDMSSNACDYADQAAVDTAFQSWLSGFTVTGGCDPQATDLTSLSAPILCAGGTVNVTYNVTDLCGTAQDVASFTITAAPALVVSDVSDMSSNACDYADQAAVDTAFQSWLSGFTVTGGCDPQATDLTSLSAPILCAGGTVNVTYNVTDLCGTAQDVASFTITAAPALVVSDVSDMSSNACDYADQAAVDTAFQSWLSGFTVTGGCDPQATDLTSLSAPILCAGGTVNVTYNVTDLCGTAQDVASFTITAAPALVVSDVSDMSSNACDYADQAAVDTAFQSWLSGFTVTGGCDPQATDLTSLSAPILCAGGTVNVTYDVTDLCGTAQDVASFTITAAPALVVSDVSDMSSNACDYADQAAVDTAFQSWLSGFTVTGGCDPQATDLTSLSAPILCAGGTVNVTYNVTDLCGTAQDVASFTITAAPALVVSDVSDMSSNACDYADQAAVDTAFQSWLSGFTVTGGCDPQATDLTSLSAPILCAGGTVNVTYNVTDLCGTAQDVASFTITAAPALVVSDVSDMSSNACDYADQAAVDTAFQSWLSGFTVTGGCDPQATDLTSLSAPILCAGGTVNVTYNVTDLCGTAQDVASFTITAAPALVVSDVSDMSSNACDYADQAAVDTAFQSWLSGFTVTGGCDPQATDLTSLSAPILCAGGTVNVTYDVTDLCGTAQDVASFTITAAPALVVSDVSDMSSNACDYADQAAVDTAFQSWLSGFTVTGGCDPQATDLTSLSAPILCSGGTVNVTYNVTDLCGTAQDVASFTITAAPALVVSDVTDMSSNACDYADQAAVDTAFQSWLSGFTVTGGCDPQATDLTSLSAPILCAGGTVNVTYDVTDLCGTAQDVASFTITAAPALVVSDVTDMSSNACDYADQAAVDTAFQSWLSGFTVTGGCDPQATDLTSLSAPILCAGGTVNVTYNVTDLCGTAQDVASFTITAAPALVVSDVTDMSSNACDYADQAAVDTAFQSWLSGFTVTGGCDPQATDLTSLSAPILCSGGTVNVTYNVTDLCGTAQDVASFTITAAPALVVSDVSDMSSNACDYADQAAVDTAFQSWLSGFTVTGGCDPQATDLTSLSAPILCSGGTVNVTYNVTDLCGTAQDVASFTITAAPALVVSDVTDMSSNACDYADQAAVDTAFQSWLSGFTVTGGCDPQATDLTSLSAPILCAGGTVNVTYNVTDLCGTAQDVASFTITAAPALVVSDVSDMSSNACDYADQAAVDTAFQSWLSGFTVTGGCDPQATDLTSLSAPILCSGGTVNVTYNVTDLCGTAQDVASFTITAAPALVVSDVSDMSSNACDYADQAAVDTAFQSWLSGFTVTGGCDPQATDLTSLSAPILCAGGTVNVTYNVTDLCGTAQDVASFTITAAPALVVSDVSDMSSNACDYADQAAVDTAFQSWLSGFTVTGGCDPQATDLTSLSAPILCAGGTVNVTYNVTDLCGTAQDVASFTITAAPALVVSDVSDMSSNACDYADQAAVDTAFQSWLSGFTVTGGCDPQATDLTSLSAPILCAGGTVNVTYNVTDLCGTAQDVASFTITAAPALVVSDVSDMSSNACDYADQAAVDTAFQSWLSGFTVTGGCDPQATDLTSLSAPILCAGGTVNVTYNVTDLCGTAQDVASFTITAAPALVVSDVSDMSSNACDYADQAAVDTAFQSWLSGFTVTGGCDPQATDLTSLSAPILCAGGTVNVTYDVTDLCGTAQDVASFTITAAPALVVSDVSDMSSNACDYADQAAVDTAFQSWLSGFTVTGGCDPQATDLTSLSAPILCAGGTVNVTYNVTDLCGTAQDVASFTITAAPALVVSDVSDMSSNACDYADQAAVDTAFQSWLSGFTVTGGCDPQATDLTSLSAPILCAGGTVNVTYNVTDLCGTAQDVASFTITAAPALVVSDVSDMSSNACDYADQAAVDTAFQSWLSGFTVTGGCDPQATDLTSLSAPILCAGGTVNVTYNVTDLCGTAQDVASFTITAAPALVVSDVSDMSSNACDYADQAAVDTAFQSWLSGFTVTGGCDPQATDLTSLSAPILCAGGTVNVTYDVTDLCGTAQDVASFTITAAPALVVSDVSDMSSNACDYADQAAVDTAFQSWLSGFTVTGGCDPQATDLTSLSAPILCAGGTVNVTYDVTDLCGTAQDVASFTITAATAPIFVETLPADQTVECDTVPTAPTLTASDNCGTATVTYSETNTAGTCDNAFTLTRTWTATDTCGLTTVHNQIIMVQDTTDPMFVEALPADQTVECDAVPTAPTLTATDNCGTATVTYSETNTAGTCDNAYTLTRTWTATDACGLTTVHNQIIMVQDTTDPMFVEALPADQTVECDAVPTAPTLTATDNCGTATVTYSETNTAGSCANDYILTRTWTAIDACGLTTVHNQTITVQDTTAPTTTTDISDVTVNCDAISEVPTLDLQDNCSTATLVNFNETNTPSSANGDYIITREWTIEDDCGNSDILIQTIAVIAQENITEMNDSRCFDEGIIDLFDFYSGTDTTGTWEVISGNTILNNNIFDPINVDLGDYIFKYSITTTDGCIDTTRVTININDLCQVLGCDDSNNVIISKTVTPNGDTWNEYFEVKGTELCDYTVEVKLFNRWGALIYESNDYQNNWNGFAHNRSAGGSNTVPNGTYYYIVNIKNSGFEPFAGFIYVGTK